MLRAPQIWDRVFRNTKMVVQEGPFRGIRLVNEAMLAGGDLCAKLIGTYELELHALLSRISYRNYGAIIDIGCSDGFYAVGFAKLFPDAVVHANDTSSEAQRITGLNAARNGFSERIIIGGVVDRVFLLELACGYEQLLVFCDIEGAERQLLGDAEVAAGLANADLIVEAHDLFDPLITPAIWASFSGTHRIEVIHQKGRDLHQFAYLSDFPEIDNYTALCEHRSSGQHWLFCEARDPLLSVSTRETSLTTFHGTRIYLDIETLELRHGPSDKVPHNVTFVPRGRRGVMMWTDEEARVPIACNARGSFAVRDPGFAPTVFGIVAAPEIGRVGLRTGTNYLTAIPGGRVMATAPHCRQWEWFNL